MATDSVTARPSTWTIPNWLRGLAVLGLMTGVLVLLGLGWVWTSSPMVVVVDGHRHQVRTHAITVGDALRRAGFDLHPEDLVSPSLETLLQSDTVVQVQRAQPVTLGADGQIRQFRTQATTIGSFLAQEGVALSPADEIWLNDRQVGPDTSLSHGLGTAGGENPDAPMIALRRAASLTLNDGGEATTLHTTLTTVGQVLQEHGVILFLGDEVSPGFQERIVPGMAVTIHRSVPVQIEADGRVIRTRTRADTVAGVLGQEGIALVGKDRVEPDLGDTLQADSTIRVTRVREEYVVEFDPIPFEMIWVPDPEVEIDNIRLVQDGQVGLTKRRYRVTFEDELEVSRTLEDIWAEQPPITKTMAYGTKIVVRTTDSPDGPIEYWRKMRVYLVSYKPSSCGKPPDHPRYGYTRLGWFLEKGIVAVDPDVIPLRTNLYVPGYGLARAGDTGGGVRGKMVDLGFSDDDYESWHWWADIYVLTPVPQRDKIRWVLPNWPKYPDRRR